MDLINLYVGLFSFRERSAVVTIQVMRGLLHVYQKNPVILKP